MEMVDVKALVAYGRVGIELMASKIVSLVCATGTVALSAYLIYSPSWQGVAVVYAMVVVSMAAFKSEQPKDRPSE